MRSRRPSSRLRAKLCSLRFFPGFLGSAAAAPLVRLMHERTGSVTVSTLVLAGCALVTLACAFLFPGRREELHAELREAAESSAHLPRAG